MDTIFSDLLEFTIPTVYLTNRAFLSVDEKVRFACECAGIELISYATGMIIPKPDQASFVRVVSSRWIAEQQR